MAKILTLDLSPSGTGYAVGEPGTIPRSGVWKLKDPEDEPGRACRNLGRFLRDEFVLGVPDDVFYEAALSAAAQLGMGNAGRTADMSWMLVGAVEGLCGPYGIRPKPCRVETHRKHFTGKSRWNGRDEAKRQVVRRAQLLGYMPPEDRDDNRGDACSIFDWASHEFYKKRLPSGLVMFGERAK